MTKTQQWKNTFKVGKFTCTMTFEVGGGMSSEWKPRVPRRGELGKSEMVEYRAGRDALLTEVGVALGGPVLVVEL